MASRLTAAQDGRSSKASPGTATPSLARHGGGEYTSGPGRGRGGAGCAAASLAGHSLRVRACRLGGGVRHPRRVRDLPPHPHAGDRLLGHRRGADGAAHPVDLPSDRLPDVRRAGLAVEPAPDRRGRLPHEPAVGGLHGARSRPDGPHHRAAARGAQPMGHRRGRGSCGRDVRVRQRGMGERAPRGRPRAPHLHRRPHRVAARHLALGRVGGRSPRRPLAGGGGAHVRARAREPPPDRADGVRHRAVAVHRRSRHLAPLAPPHRLRRAPAPRPARLPLHPDPRAHLAGAAALLRAADDLGRVPLPRLRRAVPRPVRPVRQPAPVHRREMGEGGERPGRPARGAGLARRGDGSRQPRGAPARGVRVPRPADGIATSSTP